jgi:alkanesulfonate monooxygenase SsuD/methylene tetrahydromethanopterin reductase-like flavin-dependent oxidoreductase (luciferase family)
MVTHDYCVGTTGQAAAIRSRPPITTDVPTWLDQLRGLAGSGYSTILMPDTPLWQPAPGPSLGVAATVTGLRVGTWVYASPVRPAWITAWEAHSLSVLTEGRFEMGIGTGRPGIADQLRELGLPVVPASERPGQIREVVAAFGTSTAPTGIPRWRWPWAARRRRRSPPSSPTSGIS